MKALCIQTGSRIAPWGDPVGEIPVLNEPLAQVQARALAAVGATVVHANGVDATGVDLTGGDAPPSEAHFVYTDRTWFTPELLRLLLEAGPGRLQIAHEGWWQSTGPLQAVPEPGLYELGLHPGGPGGLESLAPVVVDPGFAELELPRPHPVLAPALRPVLHGPAMVHQLHHWTHVVRVNQLALGALAHEGRLLWERASLWWKLTRGLGLLLRARSVHPAALAAAITEQGRACEIHPTAVVEACRLGDRVKIGAHAVVRGAVLGDDVVVDEHATVLMSVLGAGVHVSRYGFVNLCVSWPGAWISHGGGYQCSAIGHEAFLAWDAVALDLSMGGPVKVEHEGQRVSSGHHFLGVAIGHRARLGNAVRLNHGLSVPNDAFLVADARDLLRRWEDAPVNQGPLLVRDGRPVPAKGS